MNPIHCTLGLLTYNSAATLERCLTSAVGFSDIVIADGGSTDRTLEIAERYGARVIPQTALRAPIKDFARERNLLLTTATEKWFFYLDSDEVMSQELVEEIRRLTKDSATKEQAFRVRYLKTNEELTKIYRTFKEYYQVRLVRTDIGARFERAVHERLTLPKNTLMGQIEAPWYVLLDKDDLSLRVFVPKAWKRIGIQAAEWRPRNPLEAFMRIIGTPLTLVSKSLVKMIAVPLRWGNKGIPTKYEFLRLIYALCIPLRHFARLLSLLVGMGRNKEKQDSGKE
ncbi:MAG: glycosyltransferase [Candidatus Pacebacteria bacterium]|nr:glycosyltransferase [Candidatus Paceibacterota bacterium]